MWLRLKQWGRHTKLHQFPCLLALALPSDKPMCCYVVSLAAEWRGTQTC